MTAAIRHPTPPPKIPDHISAPPAKDSAERKIDRQMQDSFPASDPPSYSGGEYAIGAPKGRESEPPRPDAQDVAAAAKKVKQGAVTPDKY